LLEDDALFDSGRRVILLASSETPAGSSPTSRESKEREVEVEFFRRQHGRCIVKFRGIDSISDAEKYVGNELRIPAETLPVLKEGWFYTFQLKGCQVFASDGELLGTLTDVLDFGGTEILKVDLGDQETLIPFAQEYLKKVDLAESRIVVDLPEGLRDLNK
jgi:16S rRNA processing protein RimM